MFAEKDERELKHRWVNNQKNFEKIRADVLAVAVRERLEILSRGATDMEVDTLDNEKAPRGEESWTTNEWLEWTRDEEQLDYICNGKATKG